MDEHFCRIKLLNQSYDIKCPQEEEDNLIYAAKKLNDLSLQQKAKFQTIDDFQALFLAALTLSHELLNSQKAHEKQREQMNQFIGSLEKKINKVVEGVETKA